MGGGNVIVINSKAEWDAQISGGANSGKAIIVDFTATWCGPCRMIGPVFEDLSTKHSGVVFLKVDVDAVSDVAAACNISAMPTFHVYKDGQKVDELVGASKDRLIALIAKYA